jgi:hypothetical protein
MRTLALVASLLSFAVSAAAQNCAHTSVGLVPLPDLGSGLYLGFPGGLYPNGANVPPPAHAALGQLAAAGVVPRLSDGTPAPSTGGGRVVLLSLGMSNATQEFAAFKSFSDADRFRRPGLVVVDGAQGGVPADEMANPAAAYWTTTLPARLAAAGVTPAQVQVVWLKNALAAPTGGFPAATLALETHLRAIVLNAKSFFPNLRQAFLSSRTYGGYAAGSLNPEPYAYESGFAVKWLIEAQITGDPALNADPANGPVVAPWIGFGPYLWADGLTARSDGLFYECREFGPDGVHPAALGRFKVAQQLDEFFRSSPFSNWYATPVPHAVPPGLYLYGEGTPGAAGVPLLVATGGPALGTTFNGLGVAGAAPFAPGIVFVSLGYEDLVIDGGRIHVAPDGLILPDVNFASTFSTNAVGFGAIVLGIPNDPALTGAAVYAQVAVADPTGAGFPSLGGFALSRGARLVFGVAP